MTDDIEPIYSSSKAALKTALNWYERQVTSSGFQGIDPSEEAAFYNAFEVLKIGGNWDLLQLFYSWAKPTLFDEDHLLKINPNGPMASRSVYFKAWEVFAAHNCGFYDLSLGAIDKLLTFQDVSSGGFLVSESPPKIDPTQYIDMNATSLGGLAALVTGKRSASEAAGICILEMLRIQPDFPNKMFSYCRISPFSLVTAIPSSIGPHDEMTDIYRESSGERRTDLDPYHFTLDNKSPGAKPYAIFSMTLVFLCYLYLYTHNMKYLKGAYKIHDFLLSAGDECWISGQTTKVLWGTSLLYYADRDPVVLKEIFKLTKSLCEKQVPGSGWVAPVLNCDFSQQPHWISLALTGDVILGLSAAQRYVFPFIR